MKEMTNLEWYKLCIWAYSKVKAWGNVHKHHIKPKCLYPDLAEDMRNIIEVPAIVHWALHKWLFDYYVSVGNDEAVEKLRHVDIESFINEGQKNYAKNHPTQLYDFSKADEILNVIKDKIYQYAISKRDYNISDDVYTKYEQSLNHKRVKDMSDEERQTRSSLRTLKQASGSQFNSAKKDLQKINDLVLGKFGIEIKDELEPFSDKDVSNLIGCQMLQNDL